jgi:hypothetical protein
MNASLRHRRPSRARNRARRLPAWLACRRLLAALGLIGGVSASGAAEAAECVGLRGGELVLNASDTCQAQLKRDPALRRAVVRTIDQQQLAGDAALAPAVAIRQTAQPGARAVHGLTHPLARLTALNAQSRYLWALGNPAPAYYGQTAP